MSEHGGQIIGSRLAAWGVGHLFTLCGGHISPILLGAKNAGIGVIDVRDERNAVFAADAAARMTGRPGVAAVTAGPGVTNTITAVKNAQLAQSPVLILGGATATMLSGKGSLQDIDQLSLMKPATKLATRCTQVSALAATIDQALEVAVSGVPGPVFVEVPVDLLYPEEVVRQWYWDESGLRDAESLAAKAMKLYLQGHLYRQFHAPEIPTPRKVASWVKGAAPRIPKSGVEKVSEVATLLKQAKKPVFVIGSQALVNVQEASEIAESVARLGVPTYLGGSARGLLGDKSPIQLRHKRSKALRSADFVLIAGFPFDFRLGYGRSINKDANLVSVNLSATDLKKNRKPTLGLEMHPGEFLVALASEYGTERGNWDGWFATLREREAARDKEIAEIGEQKTQGGINPVTFFMHLERAIADDAVLVVDGGDFVATGAYILKPRKPLSWLDPGVFGTLGVGGGFALGAALCRPESEVWLIYGDGSSAYSLSEFDTCVRHGVAPIAVIGNDGSWAQIAREQVEILDSDIGTVLRRNAYHTVAEGYGAKGLLLDDVKKIDETVKAAQELARKGTPVVINLMIGESDFRKGSLSM